MCAVGALSASNAAAGQPEGLLTFEAAPGAFPVDGRGGSWGDVAVWEYQRVVKVDAATDNGADWIRIELNGRAGEALTAGTYLNVRNHETHPDGPGIQIVSNGLGCSDDYATVTIDRIERDDDQVTALDATVDQHCGSPDGPVFHAQVHYAG
ncbi:hypothetical protein [Actinocrispum wychmicini]|uniref:hypothetical protein n=1 Tax=Actinocrispum wychmicini TaxID=1213861 RepID=UPI00105224FE|nr:hypothetical protein [Actinocrispum wychmicini]